MIIYPSFQENYPPYNKGDSFFLQKTFNPRTMKNKTFILICAVTALLSSCCNKQKTLQKAKSITAGEHTQVQTTYGPIEGYLDGEIYTFKGIQYAKAERFMPPQFPDKFTELKQCKLYGPQAPQGESLRWSGNNQTDYAFGNQFVLEPMDEEDCLVLNVWTPGINDGKKRPVFLWVHGGGYASGSGHDLPCYEGYALAEKGDIVTVNINHRLNILGYLDLSGLGGKYAESVNLGMQDIVKSLEWVRDNIEKFGGDPNNVTIGGQSGGGGKISTILAMPSAKGLFHKAIVQSGSTLRHTESSTSQMLGLAVVKELGINPSQPEKLNEFTYDELVAAGNRATRKLGEEMRAKGIRGRFGYSPTVDGKILPQHPFDPAAPEISREVPMLIGTDFNEFTFDINMQVTPEEVKQKLTERMGKERALKYMEAFQKAYPNHEPKEMLYADLGFRSGAVKQAAIKSAQGGANAYLYLFTWKPESNALGASHGMELPFMFNNVAVMREMTGSSERAYKFEDLVSSAWLSFIKTGNPNTPGIPNWEPYNTETGPTMILDDVCQLVYNHDKELIEYGNSPF